MIASVDAIHKRCLDTASHEANFDAVDGCSGSVEAAAGQHDVKVTRSVDEVESGDVEVAVDVMMLLVVAGGKAAAVPSAPMKEYSSSRMC